MILRSIELSREFSGRDSSRNTVRGQCGAQLMHYSDSNHHSRQRSLPMKYITCFAILIGALVFGQAAAQTSQPLPIVAENLHWTTSPSGAQVAWVVGVEKDPNLYLLRVKLPQGTKTSPHTHPDERIFMVLTGTLLVGFGEAFDETKLVPVPTGAAFVVPAGVPHYAWAKEGEMLLIKNPAKGRPVLT